jgi:hypothetical protein
MVDNRIIDRSFNIGNQALAVMNYLDVSSDFLPYENGRYMGADFNTKPWYNGRERGVVVSMSINFAKTLHIAFFEHRNSDTICALKWETDRPYFNHPLEDPNIFDIAYGGKEKTKWDTSFSVSPGEAGKMAHWIYEQFEKYYQEQTEAIK